MRKHLEMFHANKSEINKSAFFFLNTNFTIFKIEICGSLFRMGPLFRKPVFSQVQDRGLGTALRGWPYKLYILKISIPQHYKTDG